MEPYREETISPLRNRYTYSTIYKTVVTIPAAVNYLKGRNLLIGHREPMMPRNYPTDKIMA